MESKKIREPVQSRSIEKKNKIIKAAYKLFSDVGYYNANTTDIAKKAGVSTGIVYGYFKDKHDILLYVIDIYIEKVATPCMNYFAELSAPIDIDSIVWDIIDMTTKIHEDNANLHNILHSLSASDEEIRGKFLWLEDHISTNVTETLLKFGVTTPNLKEKIHIAMNSIQFFSHEYVYDRHDYINYEEMKKETVNMIIHLFKE